MIYAALGYFISPPKGKTEMDKAERVIKWDVGVDFKEHTTPEDVARVMLGVKKPSEVVTPKDEE